MTQHRKLKRNAQRAHFQRRAKERLGYDLTVSEIIEIRKQVRSGTGELITRPNNRLSVWRVNINSRKMVVVYDLETDELVTMMNETAWQAQDMANSPYVENKGTLRSSLADTPAGAVLAALRGREDESGENVEG